MWSNCTMELCSISTQDCHMWQSRVEIEGYSITYLDRIAVLEALCRWTSVKGGAHMCFVDLLDIHAYTKRVWALPLMEVQWYGASNTVVWLKYAMEWSSISTRDCHMSLSRSMKIFLPSFPFCSTGWVRHYCISQETGRSYTRGTGDRRRRQVANRYYARLGCLYCVVLEYEILNKKILHLSDALYYAVYNYS